MTTTPSPITQREGDMINWLQIEADGREWPRSGVVWAVAPAVTHVGRAWWVLPAPNTPTPVLGEGSVILVAQRGVRGRCGMEVDGRFGTRGGRMIDKGEFYAESHPAAYVHSTLHRRVPNPPVAVSGRPTTTYAETELATFNALIAASERSITSGRSVEVSDQ